jgi:hypothetical protein
MQSNQPIYAIQGLYRKKWKTQWTGFTLSQAINTYKMKKYRETPLYSYFADWQVINSETGEVVPMPELHVPVRLPGHKIETIPCTDDELKNSLQNEIYFIDSRKDGTLVYKWGSFHSQGIIAYQMIDGTHRITPKAWRPGHD